MINYFLKVTICWGLFYLIYTLFLSKETFFKINRWYLLGTLILGLLIPIIPIDLLNLFAKQPTATVPYISPIVEPIVVQVQIVDTVLAVQTAKEEIRYSLLLLWLIYAIGVLVKLTRFGDGLLKIYRLYQAGTVHQKGNYKLVLTKEIHLPFSFFNYLFWSQGTHIEEKDAGTIILADACVLKDTKTKQYGQLLLKQAQSSMQLALASHFLDSQLKKRILMMTRNQSSNQALMKYLSALPLLVLMILVFSNPQVRANLNATAQLSIDYLNPHVNVPPVSPKLLLWIGGDFDREKAKKVLEAAYVAEGITITHFVILESGKKVEVEEEGDRIKELHNAAIFLVRKFPLHAKEVHELAIEVANAEGYALRFHEDGESIIYRELNPTEEKKGLEVIFEGNDDLGSWANQLLVLNNEVVGPISESIDALGDFRIPLNDIVEISAEQAVEQYGEEVGKYGAVNFFTDQFKVVEEEGRKYLQHFTTQLAEEDYLVLFNDSIVGFAPEAFAGLGNFSAPEVLQLYPEEAIIEYGEELGKNGSMNFFSSEFTVVEENGKKVVRRVVEIINPIVFLIVNGTAIGNTPVNDFVPEIAIKSKKVLTKEDVFMRGYSPSGYFGEEEVVEVTLIEEYSLIRDAWGAYNVIPKETSLSDIYPKHRLLFAKVDQMPVLKDCAISKDHSEQKNCTYQRLMKFIYKNIEYPKEARAKGINGTVNLRFTIKSDGTMSDFVITESINGLDDEVKRILQLFKEENPIWIPGQQNGQVVNVVKDIPITFEKEGDTDYFKIMNTGPLQMIKESTSNKFIPRTKEPLEVSVFPNPATDRIHVSISNENKLNDPIQIKVVSIDGRELYEKEMDGSQIWQVEKIDLANDVKGMVIVTVTRGEYSVERKVLVQ